jgi:DNA-binding LacI/PurR family transcriptional regulator
MKEHIASALRDEIANGKWKAGDCLPPIKILAQRFGTSVIPVQQAIGQLQYEDWVVPKIGDGTYVTGRRATSNPSAVALLISKGHVHDELIGLILDRLQARGICSAIVKDNPMTADVLIRDVIRSARVVFVGSSAGHFPYEAFKGISLQAKRVIGLLVWGHRELAPQVDRVLVDHEAGGRLVADRLWEAGHRRVVVLGTQTMVDAGSGSATNASGRSFEAAWKEKGGECQGLADEPVPGNEPRVVPEILLASVRGPKAATAVFGLRDYEAWQAQSILAGYDESLLRRIPIVGYGNTPWSQAARPPFSSVDWNIPAVAVEACRRFDAFWDQADPPAPGCCRIAPQWIGRGETPV